MSAERLVVIGGVAAGMSAASSFKRLKPEAEAIVLQNDHFISYGACSLPYYISDDVKDINRLISLSPEVATKERGITVLTRHEARSIDPARKTVTAVDLDGNKEKTISYDHLVVATGGLPVRPPFPGIDLGHIFTLRTLHDGIEIKRFIDRWTTFEPCVGPQCVYVNPFGAEKRPMRASIVGGGSIGMEMCESLRKRRVEVTVFEKMDRVLGTMDTSITNIVEERLAAEGVNLMKGVSVQSFEGDSGSVTRVITDKGTFDTDMVLLVIGARPNTKIAVDAGIELGAGGAIKVDDHLRTNIPDIYAAGDCAEATQMVTGKKAYIPLGATATLYVGNTEQIDPTDPGSYCFAKQLTLQPSGYVGPDVDANGAQIIQVILNETELQVFGNPRVYVLASMSLQESLVPVTIYASPADYIQIRGMLTAKVKVSGDLP